MVKILNFGQQSKYWPKIQIFVKNPNFGQKSKFWSKIQIFKIILYSAASCFDNEAFACTVPAGQGLHQNPKPITKKCPKFDVSTCNSNCDSNTYQWQLNPYNEKCYLFPRTISDYDDDTYERAESFCSQNQGLLATIHSAEENSWLTARVLF